ncbi:MAG: carboxypeptidase regulatory-like domain-containing protein [Pirellulales bacterium]|nr:carboxypeptidase regulatory-like domain-containing protein [Pirellulales bacterium]
MIRSNILQSILLSVGVLVVCGCGSSDRPELGTVSGTVTLNGKPLANAEITFQHEKKRFSTGTTDADGRYELIYIRDIKGAVVGKHTVVITAKDTARRQLVPPKYNHNTILTADVKPKHNTFDFELKTGR